MPDWLRKVVADFLAPEADVPQHAVAELMQLLSRTGALTPQPEGGDDLSDRG
jgi:hypothetical protein